MTKSSENVCYCSFCGKNQHEVRKLIAGPTVFICDECVELCMDIIREEYGSIPVDGELEYLSWDLKARHKTPVDVMHALISRLERLIAALQPQP